MNRIAIHNTAISDLYILERHPFSDKRGYLERLFCQQELNPVLKEKPIRQINRTLTRNKGTVRGMHFQYPPYSEAKIITCLRGEIFDVAIDLRKGSATFLQYHAVVLSEDNFQSFLIPDGFAHGFQALTSDCEMLYFHTADYHEGAESGLNATDPLLDIHWPLPVTERSERDSKLPMLNSEYYGIDIS